MYESTLCSPCRDLVDEAKNYLLLPQERPLMQGPRTRPRKPIRCGEVLFAGVCFSSYNLGSIGSICFPRFSICTSDFCLCESVGGWCSGDAISSVERYDPQTNEWRWHPWANGAVELVSVFWMICCMQLADMTAHLISIVWRGAAWLIQMNPWLSRFYNLINESSQGEIKYMKLIMDEKWNSTFLPSAGFVRYDPKTNQWSSDVAPTSTCRTSVGVAVLGGLSVCRGRSGWCFLSQHCRKVSIKVITGLSSKYLNGHGLKFPLGGI